MIVLLLKSAVSSLIQLHSSDALSTCISSSSQLRDSVFTSAHVLVSAHLLLILDS